MQLYVKNGVLKFFEKIENDCPALALWDIWWSPLPRQLLTDWFNPTQPDHIFAAYFLCQTGSHYDSYRKFFFFQKIMSQMCDDFSKVGEDVTKSWSGGFAPKSGRVCSKSVVNRIQVTEEKIEQESKLLRLEDLLGQLHPPAGGFEGGFMWAGVGPAWARAGWARTATRATTSWHLTAQPSPTRPRLQPTLLNIRRGKRRSWSRGSTVHK